MDNGKENKQKGLIANFKVNKNIDAKNKKGQSKKRNIQKNMSMTEDEKKIIADFRKGREQSILVFTYGERAVGKTTLHGGLFTEVRDNYVRLPKGDEKFKEGNSFYHDLSRLIKSKELPDPTPPDAFLPLDLMFTISGEDYNVRGKSSKKNEKKTFPLHFTFLEMSGEDLENVYPNYAEKRRNAKSVKQELNPIIKWAVTESKMPMVFLLTAKYEENLDAMMLQEELIDELLAYLGENKDDDHNIKGICYIISQWDRNLDENDKKKYELDGYLKEFLKQSYVKFDKMYYKNNKVHSEIFPFSIGKVNGNNKIDKLLPIFSAQLIDWLIKIKGFEKKDINVNRNSSKNNNGLFSRFFS